jgi:hypothetical protein
LLVFAAVLEVLADELLVALEDEFEEAEDAGEVEAAFGRKVLFPTAKPIAEESAPLPPMKIALVRSLLVITSWPLALSDAVTFALVGRSILMALIRSPMVSVPVEV